jgi:hypothetical protein
MPDDLTVSLLFEGRSCGFSTEHGFMLVGLGSTMWFSDLVGSGSSDVYFDVVSPDLGPSQWNRLDITFLRASHAYFFFELLNSFVS